VVDDEVSDLLLLRRLLRDTVFTVDTVRSAGQALQMLGERDYAVVITDDERLSDMPGPLLLAEVGRTRPAALRVLLAGPERAGALAEGARVGAYQLIERPFFAQPLLATLARHAKDVAAQTARDAASAREAAKRVEDDTQRTGPPIPEPEAEPTVPAPGRIAARRVLLTLAELAEAKAGYSSGHGARVSALAGVLAREAGVAADEIESVEDAALIHDVGEMAIDADVLRQARALDEKELRAVRRHVESSHQITRRAGLAPSVLAAVRHHHEHPDGSGYPDKLRGDAIPLGARIVAVADTWDALATDRPYRRAAPLAECVRIFSSLGGTQLDAALAELFVKKKLYELIDWSDPPRPGIKLL
jgi:response regulator RpfG family c-di-GMP phosphodiesterase